MGQSERPLINLGRRVAELQDQAPEARLDHERGRARLLSADLNAPPRSARPRALRIAASLAAAALLLASVAIVMRPRGAIRFDLGATEVGVVGQWIAAPASSPLPIRFSDGSQMSLAPGGRARVAKVTADGAEVALERGTLDLSIVHREGARWTVRVGPFEVRVIGTRFETSWDPVTEQLGVALREGAITVSGPVVGDSRAVRAGERLAISTATNTLIVGSISSAPVVAPSAPSAPRAEAKGAEVEGAEAPAPSEPPPSAPTPAPRAPDITSPTGQAAPQGSAAPSSVPPRTPGWRDLAGEAKYKDALAAAELEGFDGICASASAGDLRALSDAARLGGSAARAIQAFTALRRRFPGSPDAAAAAFILGRIAHDQSKDYAGAAAWFARYLSEQPGGAFAGEAAGRLVEARDKMGDEAGARAAAERYLAAHPGGSHAAYAKGVLARAQKPAAAPDGSAGKTGPAPEAPPP